METTKIKIRKGEEITMILKPSPFPNIPKKNTAKWERFIIPFKNKRNEKEKS